MKYFELTVSYSNAYMMYAIFLKHSVTNYVIADKAIFTHKSDLITVSVADSYV